MQKFCRCGGVILADTETWAVPLCGACYVKAGSPTQELVPRSAAELEVSSVPAEIEAKKNKAVLPLFTVMSEEIVRRFESGELTAETKGMKLPALINNLTKIIAAMNKSAVIIVNPGNGQAKDPSFLRANSTMHLTESEKKKRREAVDAEIVNPKETK